MIPTLDESGPSEPLDRRDLAMLAGLAAAAFVIRCYNWSRVFVGGEVRFEEFDPFGHMRRVVLTINAPDVSVVARQSIPRAPSRPV